MQGSLFISNSKGVEMRRKRIFRILSVIIFLVLFVIVYQKVERVLSLKTGSSRIYTFYHEEKKDSLDVVFMGSSHAYYGTHPMEFWKEYGVTSYVLGSPLQNIGTTYYLMKDAIKRQHPKVIAVEGFCTYHVNKVKSDRMLQTAMDGMPLSLNKIQLGEDMLADQFTLEERLPYYIPFLQYHSRWPELDSDDFKNGSNIYKGGKPVFKTRSFPAPPIITEKEELPENTLIYLEKMIKLCKENDIELMFYLTPFAGARDGEEVYIELQKIYNSLEEYLRERGIPCINYASLVDEIELDFSSDFKDIGHLNINGAKKVNIHLFQYLWENYSLEDHRVEKGYTIWNDNIEIYDKKLEDSRNKTAVGKETEDVDLEEQD